MGSWEKIAIAQKEHKNAQTIIIIIIPRQYLKRRKRVQSPSTKSHKRFACKITQTDNNLMP